MQNKELIFSCTEENHMKSIALIIQKASNFNSEIYIEKNGQRANAKSLLGVMALAIDNGDEVSLSAEGEDEEDAIDILGDHMTAAKTNV